MNFLARKAEYVHNPRQLIKRLSWNFLPKDRDELVRLPWGITLKVNPSQTIGKSIYTLGLYDIIVTESLNLLLDEGDWALDVGANIGYMTNLMAMKCGVAGRVYSFEPHSGLINNYLLPNLQFIQKAGLHNVSVQALAIADTDGEGTLFVPNEFSVNDGLASLKLTDTNSTAMSVSLAKLDSLFFNDSFIRVMKVDVEGFELGVFQGANRLLRNGNIETIIYEDHVGITSDASRYLLEKGYQIFKLNRSTNGVKLNQPTYTQDDISYEPANFLATKNIAYVNQRFALNGWTIFKLKVSQAA